MTVLGSNPPNPPACIKKLIPYSTFSEMHPLTTIFNLIFLNYSYN